MKRCYNKCFLAPLVFFLFLAAFPLTALEINNGKIRLVVHENTGRFSVYGLNENGLYEPVLSDTNTSSTFVEVSVNGSPHRLGESAAFPFHVERNGNSPAVVFESEALQIRQEFSFIKTAASAEVNGVQISIRVRNRGAAEISAGLRLLMDNRLGEYDGSNPFSVSGRDIRPETIVEGSSVLRWIARSKTLSVMGSIASSPYSGGAENPAYLSFSNIGKLNQSAGKPPAARDGDFTPPPYKYDDSAVCYYYGARPLPQYAEINCAVLLAAEDSAGFAAVNGAAEEARAADLAALEALLEQVDNHLEGKVQMSEEELAAIEETIAALKARYNLP